MGYTNSSLVEYTKISPNQSGTRNHSIDRITPHCVVGQCSIESLGALFAKSTIQASSNYGIGVDGRVGLFVPESNRSWCSSSSVNDNRAVTIECASDATAPYAFKTVVYEKLIQLCADICKRNGKTKLIWLGDKDKTLNYVPASGEMVLTVHRWFENKSCPGDWMYARMGDLADRVTKLLGGKMTRYEIGWNKDANGWWYSEDGESYYQDRWAWIEDGWYHFASNGYMQHDMDVEGTDGNRYHLDSSGRAHVIVEEDIVASEPEPEAVEAPADVRYHRLGDVKSKWYRPTLDKLIAAGILKGKAGEGEDLIIDLGEDAVRVLVLLDRAGVFGE